MKHAVFAVLGLAAAAAANQGYTSDSPSVLQSQSSPTDSVVTATFEGATYTIPVFDTSTALTFGAPNTPLPSSAEHQSESALSTHDSTCTSSKSASKPASAPLSASPSSAPPSSAPPSTSSASTSSATQVSSSAPPATTASASSSTTASAPAQQTTNAAHAVHLDVAGLVAAGLVVGMAVA